MTSCWSKSATGKRYPYYWCQTKTCKMYRKSIRDEKIDSAFAEVMQSMAPSKTMLKSVTMMLKDPWGQRLAQANAQKGNVQREIDQMDKQLDGLLDRIVETDNPTVVAAYEKKTAKLEQGKLMLADKLDQKTRSLGNPPKISGDQKWNFLGKISEEIYDVEWTI